MEGILKKIFTAASSNIVVQFMRYVVVGGIAAVVDVSLFYILANVFLFNHLIANTISFMFGLLVNYFLSRSWVFNKLEHNFLRDFVLFSIIGVLGLLLSNFILFILLDYRILYNILIFLSSDMIKLAAKLIAVFIVLFWNFIARKKIVFDI